MLSLLILTTGVAVANAVADPFERWSPIPPVVSVPAETDIPSDAIVLFDGHDTSHWYSVSKKSMTWTVVNNALQVDPHSGDIESKETFGDIQLHIEWRTPREVRGDGQDRGNSGVFLMGRYELQILDSFENATYVNGQAGAVYLQYPPLVNSSRRPGEWQSYDVIFIAPRFKPDGKLRSPARMTALQNSVLIQNDVVIRGITNLDAAPRYIKHREKEPLVLQDHWTPVQFRNIWVRELK